MSATAAKERVLIVDDEPDIRKILEMHLRLQGYQVKVATGGNEGLSFAREFVPDLIILDMMMPDMEGSQVCRILKRDDTTKSIPIIFLTAQGKRENKLAGFESGAVDYVTKPFDMGELLARVSSQLKIQALYKEIQHYVHQISLDLDLARRVQKCIIPQWVPYIQGFDIAAGYFSTEKVGGDYYDFFPMQNDQLGMLVADVSGHGISASFITAMAKMAFKHSLENYTSLVNVLNQVNTDFHDILRTEHYLTAFMAMYNKHNHVLTYTKAGHVDQILQKADGTIHTLETGGFFLGVFEDGGFEQKEVPLEEGDKLILFTDGLIECKNEEGEHYGTNRLNALLETHRSLDVATLERKLSEDQRQFLGGKSRSDDYTIVLAQVRKTTLHQELIEWAGFAITSPVFFLHLFPPYPLSGELHRMVEEMGSRGFPFDRMREIKMALHAMLNTSILSCKTSDLVIHFGWTGDDKNFYAVLARAKCGALEQVDSGLFGLLREGEGSALSIAAKVFPNISVHPSQEALSFCMIRNG